MQTLEAGIRIPGKNRRNEQNACKKYGRKVRDGRPESELTLCHHRVKPYYNTNDHNKLAQGEDVLRLSPFYQVESEK
ncbi:hypothetical protein E3J38_05630 [candidate division TA06 bacterium]|uniref:Uncharacterized protein n=1 Tax=candidate division TA06 bacterium TaxID=2250710 RepID=A0A523XMD8_UNCT6|nr:MAG: hypothetical protein E3J38_05630 [candidate division TA06 bacterium]